MKAHYEFTKVSGVWYCSHSLNFCKMYGKGKTKREVEENFIRRFYIYWRDLLWDCKRYH